MARARVRAPEACLVYAELTASVSVNLTDSLGPGGRAQERAVTLAALRAGLAGWGGADAARESVTRAPTGCQARGLHTRAIADRRLTA